MNRRQPSAGPSTADWRSGCVAYQVLVDRFAPPARANDKTNSYPRAGNQKKWSQVPKMGRFLESEGVWSHELDFWGGDLSSLKGRLGYLCDLGVEVVYLNPIFRAFTNHKYDTIDYHEVDPAFGTSEDLSRLVTSMRKKDLRLILDGVFNHVGVRSSHFTGATADPAGPLAALFRADGRGGFARWAGVPNLPELDLESPAVADMIHGRTDSVVRRYLRESGIDGWRLDVADEMGALFLSALTAAAHAEKTGSLIIGEVWNYPAGWEGCLDGVINMHFRQLILSMLLGRADGPSTARRVERVVAGAGHDFTSRCWNLMDNHDTPRLNSILHDPSARRSARILQFCLPGGACVYYGSEVGMEGGEDPGMRAPMRWDLAREGNPTFDLFRALIRLKKGEPALRHGDFTALESKGLMAFMRRSGGVENTIIVAVNPTNEKIGEALQIPDHRVHDSTRMADLLGGHGFIVRSGTLDLTLEPGQAAVLRPITGLRPGEDPRGSGCFKYKHKI